MTNKGDMRVLYMIVLEDRITNKIKQQETNQNIQNLKNKL
jgi:hypothetical protein